MSSIRTHFPGIAARRFKPFPSKPVAMSRVCKQGDGCIVGLGIDGVIYSNRVGHGNYSYPDNFTGWEDVMKGAIKLKALKPEEVRDYHRAAKAQQVARDRSYSAKHMMECAKDLGVKLTLTQAKQLERMVIPDEKP